MKAPQTTADSVTGRNFGLGKLIGLIFILIGALLILSLLDFNLPLNIKIFNAVLQYGAAIGSILGGFSMLIKKKEVSPIKLK